MSAEIPLADMIANAQEARRVSMEDKLSVEGILDDVRRNDIPNDVRWLRNRLIGAARLLRMYRDTFE